MKKKVALTAAAVAMVGTLAVGGTLAWFTDTETATNVVTTGNVDIAIYETKNEDPEYEWQKSDIQNDEGLVYSGEDNKGLTPGEELTKRVAVGNEGNNDALIKVEITFPNEVEYALNNDGTWYNDGKGGFYYLGVVEPGNFTTDLLESLTIKPELGNNYTNLSEIEVGIKAYAIQADNIRVGEDNHLVDATKSEDLVAAFENSASFEHYVEKTQVEEPVEE